MERRPGRMLPQAASCSSTSVRASSAALSAEGAVTRTRMASVIAPESPRGAADSGGRLVQRVHLLPRASPVRRVLGQLHEGAHLAEAAVDAFSHALAQELRL